MKPLAWTVVLASGMLLVGGCQRHGYNTQPLGTVSYAQAFQAGKATVSEFFSIASANESSGKIVSRPKSVDAGSDRLLGTSPARKVATVRIRQKGDQLYADVRVVIERQDVEAMARMQPITVDSQLPNQTPAQEGASVRPSQNQAWQTTGRDEAMERALINALTGRLAKK